jgi:hypothetical protein
MNAPADLTLVIPPRAVVADQDALARFVASAAGPGSSSGHPPGPLVGPSDAD